ncbi:hypothetical protein BLX41_05910 [Pseudomonas protegens]|nr:hypothetical protein BLX41_05910 [Pseudomonas protegens]
MPWLPAQGCSSSESVHKCPRDNSLARLQAGLFSDQFSHVPLTRLQRDQSLVTVSGDGDNSLSSRWVKFGSRSSMNHAAGAGGGWHPTATTRGGGVE